MGARRLIFISSLFIVLVSLLACSSREPNVLGIREFNYSALEPTYEVDSLLRLKIKRKFQFHLYPKLRTHILSNGHIEEISVPEKSEVEIKGLWVGGPFDDNKPNKVLSRFEAKSKVENSGAIHFNSELGIYFSELETASFRTRVFVQIKIVNREMAHIPGITVYGVFSFNPSQDSNHINFQEFSNDEFLTSYQNESSVLPQDSSLKIFLDYWGRYTPIQQRDMVETPKTKDYCSVLAVTEQEKCLKHPEQFFNVSRFKMVDSVLTPTPRDYERIEHQLNISATFFRELNLSERQIEADRKSTEFSMGLFSKYGYDRFGTGPSFQLGYGVKSEKFYSIEASITDDLRSRISTLENFMVRQEQLKIQIKANAKDCFFVRPNLAAVTLYRAPAILFCSQQKEITFQESWYHLHDIFQVNHSVLIDYKDPRLNSFTKKIRGEEAYQSFRKEISDKTKAFRMTKLEPKRSYLSEMVGEASSVFQDGGIFPGLIQYENVYSSKWSELQIVKLASVCSEEVLKNNPDKVFADKVCRCFYEGVSREVDDGVFSQNAEEWQSKMKEHDLEGRCVAYAKSS